eukprot:3686186-Amphidinium_carterae.4
MNCASPSEPCAPENSCPVTDAPRRSTRQDHSRFARCHRLKGTSFGRSSLAVTRHSWGRYLLTMCFINAKADAYQRHSKLPRASRDGRCM